MLLKGREVDGNTFTPLWQWVEPCKLPFAVAEFLAARLSFAACCFPTIELATKTEFVHLSSLCVQATKAGRLLQK